LIRKLSDDTLVVFLSDCHIGGDEGRDIFESPDDLAALFDDLGKQTVPVDLVLAGDFFDLLRISGVLRGETRASTTIARNEYADVFAALRRFAAGPNRTVVYLPGNHDAEAWWNRDIRRELERGGLVHEFALSYTASFESEPDQLIYCEHGNQFDPTNTFHDYDDPLDTPLGDHVVTDLLPRFPKGWVVEGGDLRDIGRVFPLLSITTWLAGRVFYQLVRQAIRWLLLPLVVALGAHDVLAYAFGHREGFWDGLVVNLVYDIGVLLLVFAVFLLVTGRVVKRAISASSHHLGESADEAARIRARLERGEPPPLGEPVPGDVCVFVSGHTHAPALSRFGDRGVVVNSGCWLRQLQPVPARLGAPPVFVSRFVQTHVRVYRSPSSIQVELWEHPRPSEQRLSVAERLAVVGRLPAEPASRGQPRIRAAGASPEGIF
jgi:Calcineurin-like phosphoesterase